MKLYMQGLVFFVLTLIILPQFSSIVSALPTSSPSLPQADLPQVDFENILNHVEAFSEMGSRVVGYDGFYDAANYIKSYWSSLGLTTREESFNVVTPIVERSSLTYQVPNGQKVIVDAYPLWPNHINPSPYTSPESGDRLIYVDNGLPEDFDKVDPKGAFVLMDFNNRWYWKYAALFGAKGVIFTEPEDMTSVQAVQKMLSIPMNFPRLYVKIETASILKDLIATNGEVKVWVDSSMVWKEKQVANLVAVIEGADSSLKNEITIIGAYYDSWSVIPQVSPGATDSMGVAFLLELSRLLKANPPRRTVWLVAFAGHYQALVGAREFVEYHFDDLGSKLKMMMSLDLASESDFLAVYASGSMYRYNQPSILTRGYNEWKTKIFGEWLPSIERSLGQTFHLIDGILWTYPSWIRGNPPYEPFLRYFEAEVFTEACYGGGMGFVTTNSFRLFQYTPFDTFERIQPENLRKQVTLLWPLLYNSTSIPFRNVDPVNGIDIFLAPKRVSTSGDWGLATVTLQLALYNRTTDWFNDYAHEDALFFVSVSGVYSSSGIVVAGFSAAGAGGPSRTAVVQGVTAGLFAAPPVNPQDPSSMLGTALGFTTIVKPDANGQVVLKGIKPLTGIDAQAYVLDPKSGVIKSATDTGPFGTSKVRLGGLFGQASSASAPTLTVGTGGIGYLAGIGAGARAFSIMVPHAKRYVPIFNASAIAILGMFDPINIQDPQALFVDVYNFVSHSYYVWRDALETWPEAMIFVQPNEPGRMVISEIIIRSRTTGNTVAVLNNASVSQPDGQGFVVGEGETLVLTILNAVRDMYYLAYGRAGFLRAKMSANPKLVIYLDRMEKFKHLADEAANNGIESELYSYSISYWQYALSAYQSSFGLIFDVVQTATFFFFLSAAFIILFARIVAGRETGIRRMLIIVALFIVTNLALSLVHPGYTVSSNIWMLVDGLAIILLTFLLFYIVTDEFNAAVKSISQSVLGFHQSDIERGSLIFSALSMGVENLKKRPLRTGLTLSTIVITISAMTVFTTMGVIIQSYRTSMGTPSYTGMLVTRPVPDVMSNPISELYLIAFKNIASQGLGEFKSDPRAWVYTPGQKMLLTWNPTNSTIRALLAITPDEAKILEGAILPGEGTTFVPGATRVVLISKTVADALTNDLGMLVERGSKINLYGISVTVMGIVDDEMGNALLSNDLNQGKLTPMDQTATSMTRLPVYLPLSNVIIVPYDFALQYFNVQPNIISERAQSKVKGEDMWARAFDLSLTLPFDIYYGIKEENIATKAAKRDIYSLSGAENLIIPLFLSSLTILSMMLSSVYERTREITTLSTVGLSPRHIGAIFVMESVALAFIGSFLGYMAGAGTTSLLWNLNLFPPELIPNVSSGVVIIVMGVMMASTMLSSFYPIMKASKLATPSLLRKWRIGSKPVEGSWSISLPFNATSDEALGVLRFLTEFFEASATERTGLFMILQPVQLMQDGERRFITTRLQLSPFDAGIIQDFQVICRRTATDKFGFEILIKRVLGVENLWITSNKSLLNNLRKQFLIWRSLPPSEKQRYIEEARKRWIKQ